MFRSSNFAAEVLLFKFRSNYEIPGHSSLLSAKPLGIVDYPQKGDESCIAFEIQVEFVTF